VDHQIVDAFWASAFLAVFSVVGWYLHRNEDRHDRAEAKFDEIEDNMGDIRWRSNFPPWSSAKRNPRQ
jgi:hypothetical protein